MQEMIKFSILVPVYNVEDYISECIESVLCQTYQNFELILVDDGTPDKSGEICEEYAKKDSRIHVYHKENGGQLHTREYAIKRASGDWYVFLDSDDELKPHALQTIFDTIQQHHCDCVIYGFEKKQDDAVIEKIKADIHECVFEDKRLLYKKILSDDCYNSLWRKAVKADCLGIWDFSDYYHIQLGEDLLQSLEIMESAKRVVFIGDILYVYRMRESSITHQKDLSKDLIDFTIYEKILAELKEKNLFTEKDYTEYRGACIKRLTEMLWTIAISNASVEHKKAFFETIAQSNYYQTFLNAGAYQKKTVGKKHFMFLLFRMERYQSIFFLEKAIYFIKNIF